MRHGSLGRLVRNVDCSTSAAVTALRRHRVRQAKERLRLGAGWENDELVFTNETGQPVDATKMLRELVRAAAPARRLGADAV